METLIGKRKQSFMFTFSLTTYYTYICQLFAHVESVTCDNLDIICFFFSFFFLFLYLFFSSLLPINLVNKVD